MISSTSRIRRKVENGNIVIRTYWVNTSFPDSLLNFKFLKTLIRKDYLDMTLKIISLKCIYIVYIVDTLTNPTYKANTKLETFYYLKTVKKEKK